LHVEKKEKYFHMFLQFEDLLGLEKSIEELSSETLVLRKTAPKFYFPCKILLKHFLRSEICSVICVTVKIAGVIFFNKERKSLKPRLTCHLILLFIIQCFALKHCLFLESSCFVGAA
jgi:hypothetical protein